MVLLPSNEPSAVLQLVSLPPEEPDEGNQMTKTIWGQGWGKENPARKTRAGFEIVRPVRLELTRHKTLEPKSSASANSATGANTIATEHSVLEATLNSIQGGRPSTEIHFSDRGG